MATTPSPTILGATIETPDIYRFNENTFLWEDANMKLTIPRSGFAAAAIPMTDFMCGGEYTNDDWIVVAGGFYNSNRLENTEIVKVLFGCIFTYQYIIP